MRLFTNSPTSGSGITLVVCRSCHWVKPGEVYQSSVPPCGPPVWMCLQSTMLRYSCIIPLADAGTLFTFGTRSWCVWIPSPAIRRVGWRGVFDAPRNRATVL